MLRLAVLFAAAAIAFDAIGALLAKVFAFNYSQLALLCIVLFVLMGIYAGRTLPRGRALVAILIAAAAEASIGWYVAATIGPGRPPSGTPVIPLAIIGVIVDGVAGAIGIAFGQRAARGTAKS